MSAEQRLAAAEPFWTDEQSTDQQVEAIAAIEAVLGVAQGLNH